MREITTKVYDFDELSKEAQEKAIQTYRDYQDFPWLTDDLQNELEEQLKKHHITYEYLPNVYYSLSYSQGDGVMFEGTVKWKQYTITIKQQGLYSHEYSKTFDIDLTNGNNISMATHEKIVDQFDEIYISICKHLKKYGYDEIEAQTSDEDIAQWLRENEYEFYENGEAL